MGKGVLDEHYPKFSARGALRGVSGMIPVWN